MMIKIRRNAKIVLIQISAILAQGKEYVKLAIKTTILHSTQSYVLANAQQAHTMQLAQQETQTHQY